MKRALIKGLAVCQVELQDFPVASSFFWTDCADNVSPETHQWDGAQIVAKPVVQPDPRVALDVAEAAVVQADSQVVTFLNFSPTQLDNWVDNNIGNAATLAALKTTCSTAFKVLGRITLAAGRGRSLR